MESRPNINLAISDPARRKRLLKIVRPHFSVTTYSSPEELLSGDPLDDWEFTVISENWFVKNLPKLEGKLRSLFVVDMAHGQSSATTEEAVAKKAYGHMEKGALECLTPDLNPQEIVGTLQFSLNIRGESPPGPAAKMIKPLMITAGIGILVAGLFFGFRHLTPANRSFPRGTHNPYFHLLSPMPIGMAPQGDSLWVCDWYEQDFLHFRIGEDLELINKIHVNDFSPLAICLNSQGLWSLGNDGKLRLHDVTKGLAVQNTFNSVVNNPAGLACDEASFWTHDTAEKKLVKFQLFPVPSIIERSSLPVAEPIGLIVDGDSLWVFDNQTRTVQSFKDVNGTWGFSGSKAVPHFGANMNQPIGFSGDKKAAWISSEKSGILYRLELPL